MQLTRKTRAVQICAIVFIACAGFGSRKWTSEKLITVKCSSPNMFRNRLSCDGKGDNKQSLYLFLGKAININLATAADLEAIPGVTRHIAQSIIKLREDRGYFTSLDELVEAKNIGPKKLAALRDYIEIVKN